AFDVGAIEYQGNGTGTAAAIGVTPSPLSFGNVIVNRNSTRTLTLQNGGVINVNNIAVAITGTGFSRSTTSPGSCGTTLAAGSSCTINVVFSAGSTTGPATGTATITATNTLTGMPAPVGGSPVSLSATVVGSPTLTSISPASG